MAHNNQEQPAVDFGIADPIIPVHLWKSEATNRFVLHGALTINGTPVAGARMLTNQFVLPDPTGSNGEFVIQRDQTVVDRTLLSVIDLSGATVGGSQLSAEFASALKAASFAIETAFAIKLDQQPALTKGAKNVAISGVAHFADGTTPIPAIALWGYSLSGVIYDTNHQPLADVYASVRDDEGETWAVSNRTAADGAYQLRFFPTGAGSNFTMRIAYGDNAAESEEELTFTGETSSQLDLMLDTSLNLVEGTGKDGVFEPKEVPGAEYVGFLTGLAVGDTPVKAAITWPDANGRITVTIPEVTFDGEASFFQERVRFFSNGENVPGSDVPAELIPVKLDPRTPRDIPPTFPVGA